MEKNKRLIISVERLKTTQCVNETHEKNKYFLNSVLSNSIISETLLSYLTFADLKALREVSHCCLSFVQNSSKFLKSAVLNLKLTCIKDIPTFLPEIKCNWLNLKINYKLPNTPKRAMDNLRCILEHVEFLSLEVSKEPPQFQKFLSDVLQTMTNLAHLQLDINLFQESKSIFTFVPDIPKNLKTLDIHWFSPFAKKRHYYQSDRSDEDFAKKFERIIMALPMKGLQTFRLTEFEPDESIVINDRRFHVSIPFLLNNNCNTIQELEMSFDVWGVRELRHLKLPNLKRLKLALAQQPDDPPNCRFYNRKKMDYEGQDTVSQFLCNHPSSLEELDIFVIGGNIYKKLFEAIKLVSKNLRKFHLTGTGVNSESTEYYSDYDNWSFLGDMKHLKDFHLSALGTHRFCAVPDFFTCLPKNQIQNLSFRNQFAGSPRDCRITIGKLQGFKNLKRLSIRRLTHDVDDELMQFVIENMKSLQELEISHSVKLTDAGICGPQRTTNCDFKSSIANLKDALKNSGLKLLAILSCPNITEEAISDAIKLPSLKSFEFLSLNPVAVSLVENLASQNPNLETLSLSLGKDALEQKEILQQVNHPRLKTLVNFSVDDWEYWDDYPDSL